MLGDATLVPGDPAIVLAISELQGVLLEGNVKINSARAVVLREPFEQEAFDSSNTFEITHQAPVGESAGTGNDEGQIISVIFLDADHDEMPIRPGSYAVRISPDNNLTEYIDASGDVVYEEVLEVEDGEISEVPTAGIFLGTKWCRNWTRWGCYSYPCGWWPF